MEQLHAAVKVLDHGRAAFDPVATVVICGAVDLANGGRVDVAAKHAIHLEILCIANNGLLEFPNEADHIFHLGLYVGAQRPVPESGEAAHQIHDPVAPHEEDIANVSQVREPSHVLNNHIQFVPVHDEQASSIRCFMNGVFLKRHAGVVSVESREEFIVVADDVNNLRPLPAFTQKFLDDVIMFLWPINATSQGPYIDEVTDKVEGVKLHILQKIEEDAGFAPTRAEMNVRNPTSAIARCHDGGDLSAGGADD